MTSCAKCGQVNDPDDRFCRFCGSPLSNPADEPAPRREATVDRGFFASLFDFSFTAFLTSRIIKSLYKFSVGLAGLAALFVIIVGVGLIGEGFDKERGDEISAGVMVLLAAPFIFIGIVVGARISLEILIVIFRIAEHTAEIAAQGRRAASVTSEK